jgi:hypothetical protein
VAAQLGAKVAVLEVLPFLGGTAVTTINRYYEGFPRDSKLRAELDAFSGANREKNRKGPWSTERRKLILQKLLLDRGGRIYSRAYAAGAVVEGDQVVGVVVEGAFGRCVILARMTVDATGHGDVAAAAGATFSKGRQGDGAMHAMALTASMANDDSGVRDPTSVADATAITLKRMALTAAGNTFSPHITPRESRHILGDHVLTLGDLVAGRTFPDAVMLCRANYDRHDLGSYADESDAAQDWIAILGGWFESLACQVPYRSLLPRGLENILVVGKAYSGDHDAHIVLRMQRDFIHMGEAAGVAAALVARSRSLARSVSWNELQNELIRRGVLRAEDLTAVEPQSDPAVAARKLGGGKEAHKAMIDCYRAGQKAIPALTTVLNSTSTEARAQAAILLGMQGQRSAIPALLEILAAGERMNGERKPITWKSARITPQPFTGAVILLGRFREKQAVAGLRRLIEDRENCPPDLAAYTIQALERIGDPAAVASIKPYLQPYQAKGKPWRETDTDESYAVQAAAARTLARLGDRSGLPVLVEFLGDDRALVRDYAQRLLESLTGQRFGKDRQRWLQWLEGRGLMGRPP